MIRTVTLLVLCLGMLACSPTYTSVPETASTLNNWAMGRSYQAQGRFEMARQYYVLALADARTPDSQTALKQEIEAAERQIEALR